jgi:hypothetical protein
MGMFILSRTSQTDYIKTVLLEPQNQQVRAADDDISAFDFIMTGLYSLMTRYVDEITSINRKRRVIQAQFAEKKRTTQQMNDLLHLQTQMIYIQNSLAYGVSLNVHVNSDSSCLPSNAVSSTVLGFNQMLKFLVSS